MFCMSFCIILILFSMLVTFSRNLMDKNVTTPNRFEIYPDANTVIIDSVTFCFDFSVARIAGGHPMGPVFELGAAKVVLTEEQAAQLIKAGVQDSK